MKRKITPSLLILTLGIIMAANLQAQDSIDINNYQTAVITVDDSLSSGYTEKRDSDSEPFVFVEQMPEFPGGNVGLFKYLVENLKYPTTAAENEIEGTVSIRLIVNRDGTFTDVKVVKSVDPALDKEAVRVVKNMPRWIPGKQNGRNVDVYFMLPITFKLQK